MTRVKNNYWKAGDLAKTWYACLAFTRSQVQSPGWQGKKMTIKMKILVRLEWWEKLELPYSASEDVKWCRHLGKWFVSPSNF
jgi:hypothetical protein